jgi:thioredoxin 1
MQEITTDTFESTVSSSEYAVVDYWAPWCSHCVAMLPNVEQVATESTVPFYKVNIDNEPVLKEQSRIRAIPALLFYRKGKIVDFLFGESTPDKIKQKLESLVEAV